MRTLVRATSTGGKGSWVDRETVTAAAREDGSPGSKRDAPHSDAASAKEAAGKASLQRQLAMLGVVLAVVIGTVHFSTGCGNSPCAGDQGECTGFLWAECVCTGGVYSGEHCQFSEMYDVSGCSNPATCGMFNRTLQLCDDAPVYQLGGREDGPVLYRSTTQNQREPSTNWAVGPSARRTDCAPIPVLGGAEGVPNVTITGGGLAFVYARSYYYDVADADLWGPAELAPSATGCVTWTSNFPLSTGALLAKMHSPPLAPPPRRR